jgi:ribosomal protein L31E
MQNEYPPTLKQKTTSVEEIKTFINETFKTEMPKIFLDWTLDNFIAKFESLRNLKPI